MRIVVSGGTGFLGAPLVRALATAGHDVLVLTRGPAGPGQITWAPDGSTGEWARSVEGAGALVNLAGAPIADRRWTAARKRELRDSRVLAARSLARAVAEARARPPLFVSMSGVNYYGPHDDEVVSETAPAGSDFMATMAVAWEAAARAAEDVGARVVLLRTGVVLAPDGGALARMLLPFRLGLGGPLGTGRQYMSWIHRQDWVDLVGWILTGAPGVDGPLNAVAPEPVTNERFTAALARALRRPHMMRAPAFAVRLALGEMADVLLTGQRVVPARATALGYEFRRPTLESALDDLL